LGVLGYAGWLTVIDFFSDHILPGDFFLHAFWTIMLVLLLSFFLLQGLIRLAVGRERLAERVFFRVQQAVEGRTGVSKNPVWREAKTILGLGQLVV
jgi:hypothetical protein